MGSVGCPATASLQEHYCVVALSTTCVGPPFVFATFSAEVTAFRIMGDGLCYTDTVP